YDGLADARGAQRSVGTLSSVTVHWQLGPIGLAVVKRNLSPEAELSFERSDGDRVVGTQETIVAPVREHERVLPARNKDVDMRNSTRCSQAAASVPEDDGIRTFAAADSGHLPSLRTTSDKTRHEPLLFPL